ncbi:MAG: leucine-rich repeat domain-containing protein [Bacteroidetes bacterium]|nr:leucine-rich repeat domain-containing protein [Bacteroidota bacterium]
MRLIIFWCLFTGIVSGIFGQNIGADSTSISEYKEQVRQLISFLEFNFNTIGDPLTSAREKEIIINQSYAKIFRDPNVQIEDDLAMYRSTVINKDIQAYLKDIDFFFKEVRFEFLIQEISHEVNESGNLYFKASMDRVLTGIDLDGDSVYDIKPRFVEVNLDPESRVLKIASIYTTKLSEKEDLTRWWNDLSFDWKQFFAENIAITDSLSMAEVIQMNDSLKIGDTLKLPDLQIVVIDGSRLFGDLKRILQAKSIDLSDNPSLTDLQPIGKLSQLKELNISGTVLSDLTPIRNMTRLEVLHCENTRIKDLSPIKYSVNLREVICGNTEIADLSPVASFENLQKLDVSYTSVSNLAPLSSLKQLKELYIQQTQVNDLSPLVDLRKLEIFNCSYTGVINLNALANLPELQNLYCESTKVNSLAPLSNAMKLRLLFADGSAIDDLIPLVKLSGLRKVYCDQSRVTAKHANQFMRQNPQCLVIYDSEVLAQWWKELSGPWKKKFREMVETSETPSREELHQVAGITRMDLKNNSEIYSLEPLQKLTNLEELYCQGVKISDLKPIADLALLESLDISRTQVSDLSPLVYLKKLKELDCSFTKVDTIIPLAKLSNLEYVNLDGTGINELNSLTRLEELKRLYCDSTKIEEKLVKDFLQKRPDCMVVFQTSVLQDWWANLSAPWKNVIQAHTKIDLEPTREQLHQTILLNAISINNNLEINSLVPLRPFLRLNFLKINNTHLQDLTPLMGLTSLKVLDCAQNPIVDLGPLTGLNKLNYLNCQNTRVTTLEPLEGLFKLEEINCSGTQIHDLKPLQALTNLKQLDCSNTDVKKLDDLDELQGLNLVKCFNTKVSEKRIEKFKESHPNCEVVFY